MNASLRYAELLADKIIQQAKTDENGQLYWEIERLNESDLQPEIIVSEDLYKGNAGVAFFLYYLQQAIPDKKLSEMVKTIRLWPEKAPDQLYKGLYNGYYGNAYVSLLIDPQNKRALEFIMADSELHTHGYDVISGHCGCILALLLILRDINLTIEIQQLILKKIGTHTAQLLRFVSVYDNHIVINRPDFENWTGYSHGQQGAIYTLQLLAAFFESPVLLNLAQSIAFFEEDTYAPELNNYPDLRSRIRHRDDFTALSWQDLKPIRENDLIEMHAWCHGLPGIAAAQAQIGQDDVDSNESIQRNGQIMGKMLPELLNDDRKCLCHGTTGNLDYFLNSSDREHAFLPPELLESVFLETANDPEINGSIVPYDCGLMCGLSGIGYFFLRYSDPKRFRSVLAPLCLSEIRELREKLNPSDQSFEELVNHSELSDLQKTIFEQVKHTPIKRFIPTEDILIWEVRKTTFRSDFDLDYRKLHLHVLASNVDLLEQEANPLDFQFVVQNNFILNPSGNSIFFFLKEGFHEIVVSETEIAILSEANKLQTIGFSYFRKWIDAIDICQPFVLQLVHLGFFKLEKPAHSA